MKTPQDILKISGLLFLLPGTLLVLMPDTINLFLNSHHAIPKAVILFCGIGLNLSGLLMLHFAKQSSFSVTKKTVVIFIHGIWLFVGVIGLQIGIWISTVNAMTVSGLWLILTAWFGWQIVKTK